ATIDVARIPCGDALRSLLRGKNRELALECLLAGGDDYELCFTANATMDARIGAVAGALGLPLIAIGTIRAEHGLVILDEDGRPLASRPRAFDHFA
ncbi:MAG TPA: thiamine-phosphate kinase, partial [Casimicrobiaceae bacterium]|nr:thiamine-phosphate kinase [Casimicrobiaceae bacterium]